jgi:hypothetical protein
MKCPKCEMLLELHEATDKTDRQYWVMTELFVMLHGSDVCEYKPDIITVKAGRYTTRLQVSRALVDGSFLSYEGTCMECMNGTCERGKQGISHT